MLNKHWYLEVANRSYTILSIMNDAEEFDVLQFNIGRCIERLVDLDCSQVTLTIHLSN